jgi:hypothetical protein
VNEAAEAHHKYESLAVVDNSVWKHYYLFMLKLLGSILKPIDVQASA